MASTDWRQLETACCDWLSKRPRRPGHVTSRLHGNHFVRADAADLQRTAGVRCEGQKRG